MVASDKFEAAAYASMVQQSKALIVEAAKELDAYPDAEMQRIQRSKKDSSRQIAMWKLQQNPWPTYRQQMETIAEQCIYLHEQQEQLKVVDVKAQAIKDLTYQTLDNCTTELKQASQIAEDTIALVGEIADGKNGMTSNKLINNLEALEEETKLIHHLNSFGDQLEREIKELPDKLQVPVATDEGMLQFKEINFQRSIKQWLESEIMPVLYEVWELTEQVSNGLKMALVNIRNRVLLTTSENKENSIWEFNEAEICQPLHTFQKWTTTNMEELRKLRLLIKKRINEHFRVSEIYNTTTDFLPLPLQSTINQLKLNQNRLLVNVRQWISRQNLLLQQLRSNVEVTDAMSDSEKVVHFIKSRKPDPENTNYTSIFMTRGYIGESFWVGRQRELQHIQTLIGNWEQGYRGAVAITGQRFSGKSLYGEVVAHRHFANNTIRLAPSAAVDVQGRRMTAGFDLEEVMNFIIKYSLNARPLIWIDDLELWRDRDIPLSQNLRSLGKFIDNYSNRLFFMVSMSNWLKAHLNKMLEINRIFQSEINLDRMPMEEIREAILIRHGATHKALVDEQSKEIASKQFQQMTRKTNRLAEGNIGEALNVWAASIRKFNEDAVIYEPVTAYQLPDFLNPDSALLLATIMMEKRTNEYRLRKLFGPSFSEKYGSILQRLLSVGLLSRQLDGWLEVNEVAANEVGRKLEARQYLQFYHSTTA